MYQQAGAGHWSASSLIRSSFSHDTQKVDSANAADRFIDNFLLSEESYFPQSKDVPIYGRKLERKLIS